MGNRRLWQIHLSTAIVLLIIAGLIVGLNILHGNDGAYGWPIHFYFSKEVTKLISADQYPMTCGPGIEPQFLLLNLPVWGIASICPVSAFEYLIRRTKPHSP
jgi:hypothetical protein